jgi:hypothetical protein
MNQKKGKYYYEIYDGIVTLDNNSVELFWAIFVL